DEIEQAGGAARAVERGVFQQAIAASAYAEQRAVEAGASVVVGVNQYTDDQDSAAIPAPDYSALATQQRERVARARAQRDRPAAERALAALRAAAERAAEPLVPPIVAAVRTRATVGEISDVLRSVWGVYQPG
ncbi:MAG TPA: methylmalonyl-CoA mutase family protein, partial [Gemmatimonadales bacterium]|nr:methylmalonyl-CoA mutase family protein [Gemmatimonadales bacterium]